MSDLQLMYWAGRGLMEVPRMLLALAGKFPGDYDDLRFTTTDAMVGEKNRHFDTVDGAKLSANLGRMPTVVAGGSGIGQSTAINYYIAAENDLLGSGHMQAAQILAICEHVKEMNTAYRALCPYGVEPTPEALDKWFDTGAEDSSPAIADSSARSTRFLKWWMGRISSVLGEDGFAVGSRLSLADVVIYNAFAEFLPKEQAAETVAQYRCEAFGCKERTDKALLAFPKVKAICENVAAQPNIQKWLEIRGVQGF